NALLSFFAERKENWPNAFYKRGQRFCLMPLLFFNFVIYGVGDKQPADGCAGFLLEPQPITKSQMDNFARKIWSEFSRGDILKAIRRKTNELVAPSVDTRPKRASRYTTCPTNQIEHKSFRRERV